MKRWMLGWIAGLLSVGWAQAGIPIEHWTLANGAQVFLVQSPSLPLVDVQIDFDAGARRDPAGRSGLASATALMIGKGLKAPYPPWMKTRSARPGPMAVLCSRHRPAATA